MLGWTLSASRKGSVSPELNLGAQLLPQSQKVVLCIFVLCEKEGWNHPTLKGDNTITDTSWWAERRGLWKKHNLPHHCTAGLPCAFFFFFNEKSKLHLYSFCSHTGQALLSQWEPGKTLWISFAVARFSSHLWLWSLGNWAVGLSHH